MQVQHQLISGCSTLTRQTVAHSTAEQKFAFAGDAHLYIFSMREGAYRLESTIPFCERPTAEGFPSEGEHNKNLAGHDTFGGAGVSCLEFSPTNTKLLAATTLKSCMLEIWDTQSCSLAKIYRIEQRIMQLSWSPTN